MDIAHRTGTIFQGNYRAKAVENDGYLLHLCRYIHANPVIHGIVDDVADWPYSNYLEWIGERSGTLVDRAHVTEHFPEPDSCQKFVAEYIAERRLPEALARYLRDWEG